MIPSDKHTLPEKTAQRYVFFASELYSTSVPPPGASTAARAAPSLASWMCSKVVKISASHCGEYAL